MPKKKIEEFNFEPGFILAKKYKVLQQLGTGWEGEVYLVEELKTGIERAVKFFFPHRNLHDRAALFYAKKLHKLRHCDILIQYYTQERMYYHGLPITFLVSEFVDGELLSEFIARQPGKRLQPFQALHLLYALTSGMECIHRLKEYHGDIHSGNIIVERHGLGFDLKLVDLFNWRDATKPANIQDDICDMIDVFYQSLGGRERYTKQDEVIKSICCGMKRPLIIKKFRNSSKLREYLENLSW